MSLRSEICARLLLPLIVTLLTVLAVFKLSGTDLHFAKYCAESTLVYAAVLLRALGHLSVHRRPSDVLYRVNRHLYRAAHRDEPVVPQRDRG